MRSGWMNAKTTNRFIIQCMCAINFFSTTSFESIVYLLGTLCHLVNEHALKYNRCPVLYICSYLDYTWHFKVKCLHT